MAAEDQFAKLDRDLHKRAARKLAQGVAITALRTDEKSAYKRVEKLLEKERRESVLTNLPIGEYCRFAKRRINVVREQGERYGLPLSDRTISVPEVIEAFHDFLRDNCRKIGKQELDDPLLMGGSDDGEWLDRYRKEAALTKRLQREQMEGTLLPRADVHEVLGRSAAMIRNLIESLERKFGKDAADLARSALDGLERETRTFSGEIDAA